MMDNSDDLGIKIDAVFSLSGSLDDEIDKDKDDVSPIETDSNEANPMDSGGHDDLDEKEVGGQSGGCFIDRDSSNEPDSGEPNLRDGDGIDEASMTGVGRKDDAYPVVGVAINDRGLKEPDLLDDANYQKGLDDNKVFDEKTTLSEQVENNRDSSEEDLNEGHEIIAEWTVDSDEEETPQNERDKACTEVLKDAVENPFISHENPIESQENGSSGHLKRFSSSNERTDARSSDTMVPEDMSESVAARVQNQFSVLHLNNEDSYTVENNCSEHKHHGPGSKIKTETKVSDEGKPSKDTLAFVEKINGKKTSIRGTETFHMRSLLTGKRVDVSYPAELPPEKEESIFTVIKPCFVVLNRVNKNVSDGRVDLTTILTMKKRKSKKCSNFCRKQFLNKKFKASYRPNTCKMTCIRKGGSVILRYRTCKALESSEQAYGFNEDKFPGKIVTQPKTVQSETSQFPAEADSPPKIRSSRKRKPTSLLDDNFIIGDIAVKRKKFPAIKAESATDAKPNKNSVTDYVRCENQEEKKSTETSSNKDIQKEAEKRAKQEAVLQGLNSVKATKGDRKRKKTKFEIEIDNPEAPTAIMISPGETEHSVQRQDTEDDLTGESKILELLTGTGHRAEDVKFLILEGGLICGFVPSPDGTAIYVSKRKKTKTPAELIASIKFKPNTTTKLSNTDMTNYCAEFVKTILSPKSTGRPLTDEMFKTQAKLKAACVSIADADPAKSYQNLGPKDTVHLFIPESQPSQSSGQSDLQNSVSTGHHTYTPSVPEHSNAPPVVKVEPENVTSNISSKTNVSFGKTSTTVLSSQQNYIVYTTKPSTILTESYSCLRGSLMTVPSTVASKSSVSDTSSLLSGNLPSLASMLRDQKPTTVYTVPSKITPRVLKNILSSQINERQQKVSQSTQCFIFPSENRVSTPQKESDTIFKVIDNKTVIKYTKSKEDTDSQSGVSSQNDCDDKEKITFSANKPVAAVRPIGSSPTENPSAIIQGSALTICRNGSEIENVATEPNVATIPGNAENREISVSDFGQRELVTATGTNQLKVSEIDISGQTGVSNHVTGESLPQQLAGNNQMSSTLSGSSLEPSKQFGNVIAAVSKAEGVFKGPGKRTFYLLNVDGKNVLIPLQDNIVQPRAYVVSGNLSAEKAPEKEALILNSVESETRMSSTVEKEGNYAHPLAEKQSLLIAVNSNHEIEKQTADRLKVVKGGLRIIKPKIANDTNSSVKDKGEYDSVGKETLSKNYLKTSTEGEANDQVDLNVGDTYENTSRSKKEGTGKKCGNEKTGESELTSTVSEPAVPLTREERLKQLREKLRQQQEALEQVRNQRMMSAVNTQS